MLLPVKIMIRSIVEGIKNHAVNKPDALCVVDRFGSVCYGAIWTQIKCCAGLFLNNGIKSGDYVIVECTQDRYYVVINMACELIGAVFVPVGIKTPLSRVEEVAEETVAALFVSAHRLIDDQLMKEQKKLSVDEIMELLPLTNTYEDYSLPLGNEICQILFTTGTTGRSKGIEITHKANVAIAENVSYGVEMKNGNVELIPVPISHSHGLRSCYADFYMGGTAVLVDNITAIGDVLKMIEDYGINALDLSPSVALIMKRVYKDRIIKYRDQIDYIQIGTATLQDTEKEWLKESFPDSRIYNFYGSTEAGRVCLIDVNKDDRSKCIGYTAPNAQVGVFDDDGNMIRSSADNMGRLAFAGNQNMNGYFKQPDLTADVIKDGYVHTNDVGYVDSDGYIYLFGRADDIINCGGIKVSPDEIEESARKTGYIADCVCIGVNDDITGQAVGLYVVAKNTKTYDEKEFRRMLSAALEPERMPKTIVLIDSVPRTDNGKVIRRQICFPADNV